VVRVKVGEIMHDITVLNERLSVQFAAKIMRDKNIGSVLVEGDKGRICGIVTERDVLKKVVAVGLNPASVSLREIMSSDLITVGEDEDVTEASSLLNKFHIRRLPLVNAKGTIVGIVTARDVAKSVAYSQAQRIRGEYGKVGFLEHVQ